MIHPCHRYEDLLGTSHVRGSCSLAKVIENVKNKQVVAVKLSNFMLKAWTFLRLEEPHVDPFGSSTGSNNLHVEAV